MTSAPDTQPAQNNETVDEAADYPETWKFNEHGDRVAGGFVRFEQGQTKEFGPRVLMILDVNGVERTVWLSQTALHGRVRDELNRRPSKRLEPGERVVIKRLEKKMGESGREYWAFQVLFPDRPELEPSDLFDLDEGIVRYEKEKPAEPVQGDVGPDGDIPF
jgi:hypothetical protein